MRKLFIFLAAVSITAYMFLPQQARAQSPQKMSYQAVIRNSSDALVTSTNIGMQISILQGSSTGTVVYTETQSPTTNANGLVSIEIGGGAGFSTIDWANGPYFIKTDTDPTGGTSYTIIGTSQLTSVPYALYAQSSASDGSDGKSAYQTWLDAGNTGTEDDFLASLVGSGSTQDISLSGTELSISDGSTVDLSVLDTDSQLSEAEVDAFADNNGYLTAEVDGDVTNELNTTIILNGTDLETTDAGGTITTDLSSLVVDISGIATNADAIALKATIASPTFTGTVSGIDKTMVGLGNVDNTSDADRPISTNTQTALDLKVDTDGSKVLSTNDYTDADKTNLDANTAKVGITTVQANEIVANTAKVGYTEALVTANTSVAANTAKTGITAQQASDIVANIAKPGVTPGTSPGQMQYWNGSAWITVSPGNEGQFLAFTSGVPTWTTTVGPIDVFSPATGKIWLDRNMGAGRVATSSTDVLSFGNLYQWGRDNDGHQSRTSPTTSTLSSTDVPGHGNFILGPTTPYDWRSPQNTNLWQGVNGVNNPCLAGYRLPTETELNAERLSWSSQNSAGAFASPLKFPGAGMRSRTDGTISSTGGNYWTSTISGTFSRTLNFSSGGAYLSFMNRAAGSSVRCIKD